MGFYIRKGLNFGPVRFNLSKSGIGLSAGIKGARLGISSTGRSYVHAGREGLYYRKYLGSGTSEDSSPHLWQGNRESINLYQDNGVTFNANPQPTSDNRVTIKLIQKKQPTSIYLLFPLMGLLAMILSTDITSLPTKILIIATGSLLLLVWPFFLWKAWRKNQAGTKLRLFIEDALFNSGVLDQSQIDKLTNALSNPLLATNDHQYFCCQGYLELVLKIVKDGRVTQDELQKLIMIEGLFKLSSEFIRSARIEAFHQTYLEAVVDRELTENEEYSLKQIREALCIPESALTSELETIGQLREIREIRNGLLPVITPSVPIQQSEACHYEGSVRMLKEKVIRTFQREGQKYKVRGLVKDSEGLLLITNKRLLIIHSGSTSIPLTKIIDLEIDDDNNLLSIIKDGAKTPILLTMPDLTKAAAIIASAAAL